MKLQIGKTYNVIHSRKGKFQIKLTGQDETWAVGIITNGRANAALEYNEKEIGSEVTLRKSLASFSEA